MHNIKIAYVGMTHLGINYGVAAAGKGFGVIGYDPRADIIARLNSGDATVVEPGLTEALQARKDKLFFTDKISAITECDLVYIAPDVSTNDQGISDLSYISSLIDQVIPQLKADAVLIVLAQVPPGFTSVLPWPAAQKFYQVETLVFGQALNRAEQPERLIVGCADPQQLHPKLATFLQAFNCPVLPMGYESAELCKIAINCCLVAMVSVANTLGELCEKIGANWSEIVPALKLDKRIGPHAYLQPGLGLSGGNLERDLATVVNLSNAYGSDSSVIQAFRNNSAHRRNWPLNTLFTQVLAINPHAKVAVLGLTYKENTHSLKNSPAIKFVQDAKNCAITAYDPVINELDTSLNNVAIANSALQAAQGADVLAVMTPWAEFKELSLIQLGNVMRSKIILDPFKVFNPDAVRQAGFVYHTLGKSN